MQGNSAIPTQEVMRERLNHIAELEGYQGRDDSDFGRWADTRVDRWTVDWALRSRKYETAKQVAKDRQIEVRYLFRVMYPC